jgi:hypothetical protein
MNQNRLNGAIIEIDTNKFVKIEAWWNKSKLFDWRAVPEDLSQSQYFVSPQNPICIIAS